LREGKAFSWFQNSKHVEGVQKNISLKRKAHSIVQKIKNKKLKMRAKDSEKKQYLKPEAN